MTPIFQSEFLQVADRILRKYQTPLSPREIVNRARRAGMFSSNIAGKTPHQTLKAKLSVHIRKYGERSHFVRTAPGRFYLRTRLKGDLVEFKSTPLRPPPEQERILVFPTEAMRSLGGFQGITLKWRRYWDQLLNPQLCQYKNRLDAEEDDDHKQVLTYILVRRADEVLMYKRGTYSRVETFLKGRQCVGFGGHVSERDLNLFNLDDCGVRDSAVRELTEELSLPQADKERLRSGEGLRLVGALNDDSSIVGQRHFAFVMEYRVSNSIEWNVPQRGEKSITQLRWFRPLEGEFLPWEFEYWSQLCLEKFFPIAGQAAPSFKIIRKSRLRPPNLLVVVGKVGSGKSTTTNLLSTHFGYTEVNSGKILADLLRANWESEADRARFQEEAWKFIQTQEGPALLAERLLAEVDSVSSGRVLIDGLRQRRTLEEISQRLSRRRVGVLYVHARPDLAYEFYSHRVGKKSYEQYLRTRAAPVEEEVDYFLEEADAILYNWVGEHLYERAVLELMMEAGVDTI